MQGITAVFSFHAFALAVAAQSLACGWSVKKKKKKD
jgi:hypothetical protein